VGSVAARGVDEFDWTALQSSIVFDLPAFGAVWWYPATSTETIAICVEPNGTVGDISRLGFKAVSALDRQKSEPSAFDNQPGSSQKRRASSLSRYKLRSACLGLRNATQTM